VDRGAGIPRERMACQRQRPRSAQERSVMYMSELALKRTWSLTRPLRPVACTEAAT
jgi:hypothetical protein